jgi:cytochrome P450
MTTTNVPEDAMRAAGPSVQFEDLVSPVKQPPGWHFATYDRLREEGATHFGAASGNPFWMITRMADIRAAYQNPSTFSNSAIVPDAPNPPYLQIPEMLDPPLHTKWRRLLGPLFSPATIAAMTDKITARFDEILDDTAARGECDFVADIALRFPNTIFLEMMGLPVSDAATFQEWETAILHLGSPNSPQAIAAMGSVTEYFSTLIEERRRRPQDDIVSKAIAWHIDGEPIPDGDLLAFCLLMFMAGLDTVAAQLSYSFLHLATNPADRQRIVDHPELIPTAVEELLRFYAFVTPGRKVMQDAEIAGCPIKAGDMLFLPLSAANRDPREFRDAGRVVIDRTANHHIAFGAGPHRCLGAHLARLELTTALERWHRRIPDYELDPDVAIREHHGGLIGLDNLPLRWTV